MAWNAITNLDDPNAPYSGESGFSGKYLYPTGQRPSTFSALRFDQLGWMTETLYDLGIAARLSETIDRLPSNEDPFSILTRKLPPDYIFETIGDFAAGKSGHRTDRAAVEPLYPQKPADPSKGAAAFGEALHRMSRMIPRYLFGGIELPESAQSTQREIDQVVTNYQGLIKSHGFFHHIPVNIRQEINATLDKLFIQMDFQLSGLEIVKIIFNEEEIKALGLSHNQRELLVSNNTQLHPSCPQSNPAQTAIQLRFPARSSVNQQKLPMRAVVHSLDIIGAESMISDTMQALMDHIDRTAHNTWGGPDSIYGNLYQSLRSQTVDAVLKYARNIQFLLQFSVTTDMAYPLAYQDARHFLKMADQPSELQNLETPAEVATMLYAMSKRIARDGPALNGNSHIMLCRPDFVAGDILQLADHIAHQASTSDAFALVAGRQELVRQMRVYARELGDTNLDKTIVLLTPLRHDESLVAAASQQKMPTS